MVQISAANQRPVGRRQLLGTIASMALAAGATGTAGQSRALQTQDSEALVAYFTRTGNTRVIAGQIRRALQADLFEIESVEPYPEDYEQTVSRAARERDSGYRPPLKATVPGIASYEVVFLGFPIWGETTPPVIRSFLSQHDLSGKKIVPFITHGGYGQGRSMNVVREHASRARVINPFVLEADQERRTLTQVSRWLNGVSIRS
ncbi:MAG: flavodoxin [Alphaproteobacteria bacterium]|nr:flavodoxin [Alphaproteobacteria bacterium]